MALQILLALQLQLIYLTAAGSHPLVEVTGTWKYQRSFSIHISVLELSATWFIHVN